MEKIQELDQDMYHADTSLEPAKQCILSDCLAHSDLLPNQRQPLYNVLQENSGVFGSSIADLTSTPIVKHYISTGNAKPIKQGVYCTSYHHRKKIEKQVRCYRTALSNLVLVLKPAPLCWLGKQIKYYDSV